MNTDTDPMVQSLMPCWQCDFLALFFCYCNNGVHILLNLMKWTVEIKTPGSTAFIYLPLNKVPL